MKRAHICVAERARIRNTRESCQLIAMLPSVCPRSRAMHDDNTRASSRHSVRSHIPPPGRGSCEARTTVWREQIRQTAMRECVGCSSVTEVWVNKNRPLWSAAGRSRGMKGEYYARCFNPGRDGVMAQPPIQHRTTPHATNDTAAMAEVLRAKDV